MYITKDRGEKNNKPPQTTPKQNIHAMEVMLCIWWNCKGIAYYELLLQNETKLIPRNIVPNWTI